MNSTKNNTATTDSQLLKAFVSNRTNKGREEAAQVAFRKLVARYERLVWTICQRQLDSREDIEDAFQITFLLLASKAHRIRKPESLSHWLYGAAWKTASGLRRKNCRRRLESKNGKDELTSIVSSDNTPLETIAIRHDNEILDRQLNLLSEKYRTPLVLFYFSGLTIKQISEQLGISVSATEGRLKRGRSKLRSKLTGQGVQFAPALLVSALMPKLGAGPELIATVCQQSVTTTTSSVSILGTDAYSILSGNINAGTKVMICKTMCTLAIVSMAIVGTHIHSGPTNQQETTQITLQDNQDVAAENRVRVVGESSQDSKLCCEECDSIHESVCNHLMQVHNGLFAHACDCFRFLHGK